MKHYTFTFGVLFLLLLLMHGKAQQVEMLCTQVDDAGDITISWRSIAIASDYEYKVYASTAINGPYNLLATLPITVNFYIHPKDGERQWFYTVSAVPQPPTIGETYHSDTLGSIYLFFMNPHNRGIAILNWGRPSIPPLPSQDKDFVILRGEESSLQRWAQTDTTYYADTVHVCGKTISYQISLRDNRGCDNISNIQSHLITDFIAPATPQLDSLSVNPTTQKAELGWKPSSSSDVFGYIIYINKNGAWYPIDTIFGADNTYYVDLENDARNNIQHYCIAAIDTCFNASPMGDTLNTMIPSAFIEKCDSIVSLLWNEYRNMPNGLTGYRILVSENNGGFYIIDTVPPNLRSYTHRGINPFSTYIYYIQAYSSSNGYTASSVKIEVSFNRTENSGDIWLRYVSVINNKDIEIAVFVSDTVQYNSLLLFRSNDGNIFSKIDEKAKIVGVDNYLFTDTKVDVQTTTYLYTVGLSDECNVPFVQSDTANNIVLKTIESSSDMNEIEWTTYNGFGSRLEGYEVYRQLQTEVDFQLITNLPPYQTDYAENVWTFADQGGKFLYQVSAAEDYTNPYGFRDQSFSNWIELAKSPQAFTPNAFYPSSAIEVNRVFKPVLTYVDAKEYVFAIFDRWGNQIFYTNDISLGWDGNINGKPAAMGIYQYTLTYRLNETKMYKKQGYVTLIR